MARAYALYNLARSGSQKSSFTRPSDSLNVTDHPVPCCCEPKTSTPDTAGRGGGGGEPRDEEAPAIRHEARGKQNGRHNFVPCKQRQVHF